MDLITITVDQLNENPTLTDGLVFVSKDDEAGVRNYRKPEPVAAPEPVSEPKPAKKKDK